MNVTRLINDEFDMAPWLAAQRRLAAPLAKAAGEVGRLDGSLASLAAPVAQRLRHRLALAETEAMLWAGGTVLGRDEIGLDLHAARAASDPRALVLARWALRRLDGQGRLDDLPGFLGLRPVAIPGPTDMLIGRPRGAEFDALAGAFLAAMGQAGDLHPLARGPLCLMLWRQAALSPPEQVAEAACWSARAMADGALALRFVPMGAGGRRVWTGFGPPEDRLAAHLAAVAEGARASRRMIAQIGAWTATALRATAGLRGGTAARVIALLAAQPLVSAPAAEAGAAISRITAERMLNRLTTMGLTREVTGGGRFRLWTARMSSE